MFDRFTDRARKTMGLARHEAQRLQHDYIGTEHVLLGLAEEGSGVGASVLKNLDFDLGQIRSEVEKLVSTGETTITMGQLPFTPRAKRVLEFSLEEAGILGHTYIGTEHLLLGLIREEEGIAAQVLRNMEINLDETRAEILELLGADPSDPLLPARRGLPGYERHQALSVFPGMGPDIEGGTGLVMIPAERGSDAVWEEAIAPAMEANEIDALPSSELMDAAWSRVRTAEVLVADLTGSDPDVTFQLGLAFGLHRCPILLTQEAAALPQHLRGLRHIVYEDTQAGRETLRVNLEQAVADFLAQVRSK